MGHNPQVFQQYCQLRSSRGNEDPVAFLQHEITTRCHCFAIPQNCANQNLTLHDVTQIHQRDILNGTVFIHTQFHDFRSALGKGLSAQKTGEFQKTLNFLSCPFLRIHSHGQGEDLPHGHDLLRILRVADTGNGMHFGIQTMGR